MVPVPAQLEEATKLFLMQRDMVAASKARTNLDPETVRRLLPQFNERCRATLVYLSRETLRRRVPTIADVANAMGWSEHEAAGIVQEVSELVWTAFGPLLSVMRGEAADLGSGSLNWSVRTIAVWKDLAEAVVASDAGRADST
jgi:hypothetical protein